MSAGMLETGKSFMRLWWRNQAKVGGGGWVQWRAGLPQAGQAGVGGVVAVLRDMEGALAIFVEASWCTTRRLPEHQGGRVNRAPDDHNSCHKSASQRDKSAHGWGGWRNNVQDCSLLPGSATPFRKRNHPCRNEVEAAGTIWDDEVSSM